MHFRKEETGCATVGYTYKTTVMTSGEETACKLTVEMCKKQGHF